MKRLFIAVAACLLAPLAMAADLRVGVSIASVNDVFMSAQRESIGSYIKTQPGVSAQFEDAQSDIVRQLNQVQSFISQGVDAIIVNPVDTAATARMTKAAVAAGIPLVYINRRPDEKVLPEGVGYVGSDEIEAGRMQTKYLAEKMGGKGNIVIMMGLLSNNATYNRTQGVKDVLKQYPDIHVVAEQNADWLRDMGMNLMNNWLTSGKKIDAVASNNDEMAIGAAMALKQAGLTPGKDVLIAGTDGTSDGRAAIKSGLLSVTVYQDGRGQAQGAVDLALKLARKEAVAQREVMIPFQLITTDNYQNFSQL